MKKSLSLFAALTLGSLLAHASPTNFGFEDGLAGWTVVGNGQVVSSYTAQNGTTFLPVEGNQFLLLEGGLGTDDAPLPSTAVQTFWLSAGQSLYGYAGFYADDYFNDYGLATLTIGNGTLTLFSADVASVGGQDGSTDWTFWTYTALTSGEYTLTYSTANVGDNAYNSHAFFDAHVPDTASTLGLLALGLTGMVAARRRTFRR